MAIASLFRSSTDGKFGALQGVFIPNVLQMIGVILFMRLGWILGHVGMTAMGVIITLSSVLLFLTSLSMTAIVSNMKMRAGGAYYLISRSLGIEFGSAVGVMQCISQLCSIALCVTGFALSLNEIFPAIPLLALKVITLSTLAFISYVSTNLAMKTQILIFATLTTSIIAIFFGFTPVPETLPSFTEHSTSLTFWMAFAMFFPATTGIESGMAMSGDLRNPSRALPIGTVASVITVYLLYLGLALFLSNHVDLEYLKAHPFLLYYTNRIPLLIMLGIWAATLSSAMGAILGGPRVMQAIAKDGILPRFLAKGSGPTNQPKVATLAIFLLAMVLTIFTDINQIIPILTMACLISYALINFIAFFESFLQNPSWRPTFRIPWGISLIGCTGCFIAMFMINPGATFIVLAMVVLLCFWTSSRKVKGNWDDIRYSLFSYFVHKGTAKLSTLEKSAKNWRPHILAFFDTTVIPKNLAFFSHALNQEKGFLTFGMGLPGKNLKEAQLELRNNLKGFNIPSHVHINSNEDAVSAVDQIVRNYGFGNLKPNTVIFRVPTNYELEAFVKLLLTIHAQEKNIILLKDDPNQGFLFSDSKRQNKQIDLWWRGKYPGNFELCLALAFLLQQSKLWPRSKICIKMITQGEEFKQELIEQFQKYRSRLRIKNLEFQPLIDEEGSFFNNLVKSSCNADLTFLGLKRPRENTSVEEYKEYYEKLLESTQGLNNIAYVLSGERVKFRKIFL